MTTLFSAEIRPTDVNARPYQTAAIDAVRDAFRGGARSTLMILPTGCGKSFTAGMIVRGVAQRGGRSLVLAHRGELIEQFSESLVRLGLDVGIEKAEQYARAMGDPHAVVGTVQTLQGKRLASWPKDYFRLIVTDEAHHATAETYRSIYAHFDGALHLGITATADRADEDNLGTVFEGVAYEYSLWEAMTAPEPGPYLSRLKFVQCDVGIDLSSIRTTGGDLNAGDLEEAIGPHIEALANAVRQEVGDRPTLVFTPDVGSAMAFASALESLGLRADWCSGDRAERRDVVAAYKRGETQILCNCNLFTEGFDAPRTAAIVLARPTKSRPLYAQMIGRGTRLAPGKADCLIVDFAWMTERHKLVKPVELFDTTHTDSEVQDIAQELLLAEPGLDLVEAVARAEREHEARRRVRVAAKQREMKYKKVVYDPISFMEALDIPVRREAQSMQGTATPKQLQALERFGFQNLDGLSRQRAGLLLDQSIKRARQGKATVKQVLWLAKVGVPIERAREMSVDQASAELDRHFSGSARN